ncbi:MAG: hypothetical protein LVR00_02580 [Rhabdochlamydiaceae bacterium]
MGDYQYGNNFQLPIQPKRHLLHAFKPPLPHPQTGVLLEVTAPIPKDFLEVFQFVPLTFLFP